MTDHTKNVRVVTVRRRVWYQFCRLTCQILADIFTRVRCRGQKNVPKTGPVLVVSNHQSFLDPPVIGSRFWRRMNYLAKKPLFKSKLFGALIRSVDAIPLDQEGLGFHGVKEMLKRLRNGEMVLIFPEGMRSLDGNLNEFKKGYINVAVKTGASILPIAVDGLWAMYPPKKKLPNFFHSRARIEIGEAITPDAYRGMLEEELHDLVENRVTELFNKIRIHPPKNAA